MINYDWNCKTVDCYIETEGESDVVYNVHWIVSGVSDVVNPAGGFYSARNIGTQVLNIDDITNFIPFDQLTNEIAVAWTKTTMGEEQVLLIEQNIAEQVNLLINPVSVTLEIGVDEEN